MHGSPARIQRHTDHATSAQARRDVFADFVARKMAPLTRSLMGLAVLAFAAATLTSTLHQATVTTLAVRLAPLAPMCAIALVARRVNDRATLVMLALLYLLLLEIGIDLTVVGYSSASDWVLPGYLLLPLATSVIWPRMADFLCAMGLCALGPLPLLYSNAISNDMRFQFIVYMSIGLCISVLLYTFVTRTLQAQFRLELRLRDQAGIDALTGVSTRNHFLDLTREALVNAYNQRQPVSLIHLHTDHLKQLNHAHGHAAGDRALVELADILRVELRSQDIIGRLGGEEFAVLLPGLALPQAQAVAERLCVAVHAVPRPDGTLTISIGVAEYGSVDHSMESLLSRADRALHRAKAEGRDRVACAAPVCA